jgi:hypothetical protein
MSHWRDLGVPVCAAHTHLHKKVSHGLVAKLAKQAFAQLGQTLEADHLPAVQIDDRSLYAGADTLQGALES